ncbi:PHD finger protein 24-like [Ostrea edulis]|uniref:PHD finger protein 24-like n=1 Tax=Ostrea edulis TaxID=37623 RepID=UPI0024AF718F|nr:PHD finger protein 24-like [Ostrea edulis]
MNKSDTAWQKCLPKAVLVSSLLKHCKDHLKIRDELRSFLAEMKEDSEQIRKELKEEEKVTRILVVTIRSVHDLKHKDSSSTIRSVHYTQRKKHRDSSSNHQRKNPTGILVVTIRSVHYTQRKKHRYSSSTIRIPLCHICEKEFESSEEEFSCRVCDRVFHKECVLSIKDLHPSHISTIERVHTSVGWSCPACDDLSSLLTENELQSIIDTFDEDINPKGGQITLDEFIEYKRKQLGHNMSEDERKLSQLEFRLVDTDGNGTIDWWEFLNFQAKVKLASRDQNGLVDLLTEKEVLMAKIAFSRLDVNKDGSISELEARKVFDEYFSQLSLSDRKRNSVGETYAKHALARAMALDVKEMGTVTWTEFLHGQAQYILASRPNTSDLR